MALGDLNNLGSLSAGSGLKNLNSLGKLGQSSGLGSLNNLGSLGTQKTQSKSQEKTQELLATSKYRNELKVPEIGEKPDTFWSGGWISDTFDWLNMLSYGTVGVLKGKGFAEGVKKRESFSDQDALGQYGLPGAVAGIALDIATDPLTYIAPATVLGKIGKVTKLTPKLKSAQNAFVKTSAGKKLGEMFIYRFGQDPVYKDIAERFIKNQGQQINNIVEIAQPLIKQSKEVRELFTTTNELGQTIRRTPEDISSLSSKLDPKTKEAVTKSYTELSNIIDTKTKEMVNLGILPEDVKQNIGKYLNNQFMFHEGKTSKLITPSSVGLDTGILKKRKDLSDEVREQLGQIIDAGYLLPETAIKMTKTIENAKLFKNVSGSFATDVAEDGFLKIPDSKRWGDLAGKFVPEFIQKDLVSTFGEKSDTLLENAATRKLVGTFKFGKVILNPATHVRNFLSNFVLNSFEGMNPLDPRAMKAYTQAAGELKSKGKFYKEALEQGLGIDTFAAQELKSLLKDDGAFSKLSQPAKNALDKIAGMYEKEEQFAKMAQYIFQRQTRGLSPEEAWKVAERATFNYAQVTPFIRKARSSILGYPFLTFTYKATPQIVKTALKNPTRISNIGKIKSGVENQIPQSEQERLRASESDWVKNGFYIQLPVKDKNGRSLLLDATYLLPFGDLVTGQFFNRGINSETGQYESLPQTLTQKTPFLNVIAELNANQDFYGNRIYNTSDSIEGQTADIARHIIKFMAPPLVGDLLPGGYRQDGTRREQTIKRVIDADRGVEGSGAQTRTPVLELLRTAGVKIDPVDLNSQEYWADKLKEKAVQTFLKEKGDIRGYELLYRPESNK